MCRDLRGNNVSYIVPLALRSGGLLKTDAAGQLYPCAGRASKGRIPKERLALLPRVRLNNYEAANLQVGRFGAV